MDRITSLPDGVLENVAKHVVGPLSQCSSTLYTRLAVLRLKMHMQHKQRKEIMAWGCKLILRIFYGPAGPMAWGVAIAHTIDDLDEFIEDPDNKNLILWCPLDLFSTDGASPSLGDGLGSVLSTNPHSFAALTDEHTHAPNHYLAAMPCKHMLWWMRQLAGRAEFGEFHSRLALLEKHMGFGPNDELPSDREILMGVAAALAVDGAIVGIEARRSHIPVVEALKRVSGHSSLREVPWEWYFDMPGYIRKRHDHGHAAAKSWLFGCRPDGERLESAFDVFWDLSGMVLRKPRRNW